MHHQRVILAKKEERNSNQTVNKSIIRSLKRQDNNISCTNQIEARPRDRLDRSINQSVCRVVNNCSAAEVVVAAAAAAALAFEAF